VGADLALQLSLREPSDSKRKRKHKQSGADRSFSQGGVATHVSPGRTGAQNSPWPAVRRNSVVVLLSLTAQYPDQPSDTVTPAYVVVGSAVVLVVHADQKGSPLSDELP